MGDFSAFISTFFTCLNMPITVFGYSISLWQVFVVSVLFSVIGFAIGKIFFSMLSARD